MDGAVRAEQWACYGGRAFRLVEIVRSEGVRTRFGMWSGWYIIFPPRAVVYG